MKYSFIFQHRKLYLLRLWEEEYEVWGEQGKLKILIAEWECGGRLGHWGGIWVRHNPMCSNSTVFFAWELVLRHVTWNSLEN